MGKKMDGREGRWMNVWRSSREDRRMDGTVNEQTGRR